MPHGRTTPLRQQTSIATNEAYDAMRRQRLLGCASAIQPPAPSRACCDLASRRSHTLWPHQTRPFLSSHSTLSKRSDLDFS